MTADDALSPSSPDARPLLAASTGAVPSLRVIVVAAALLTVLVRLPFLSWVLTVDEGGYAYGARMWFSGVTLYSDELWFDRPQGIFIAFKIGMWLFGESTEALRLTVALWAAATTAVLVVLTDRMLGWRVAIIAGFVYAVVSTAPAVEGFIANAELFMLLPSTIAVWAIWQRSYLWAGLLVGIAVLLKPSGAALLPLAAIWLIQDRESFRCWIRFGLGTGVFPLLAISHGIWSVGLYGYLYPTVLFRLGAGSNPSPWIHLLAGWWFTAVIWLPLVVLAIPAWRSLRGRRERRFLGIWLATAVMGIALGGNWFVHYFLQLLPPLTILAAASVAHLADQSRWSHRTAVPIAVSLAGVAVAALIIPWTGAGPTAGADRLFDNPGYRVNSAIATYVRETTAEDETIYVAVAHADIVYLSKRQTASPFLYAQQIFESDDAFDSVVEMLNAREPTIVIAIEAQLDVVDPEGRIRTAIASGYEFERSFGELDLYRRVSRLTSGSVPQSTSD